MASTYLSRTQGTPTNAKKFTVSYWAKLNPIDNWMPVFSTEYGNGDSYIGTGLQGDTEFGFLEYYSSTNYGQVWVTNRKFRDGASFYHFLVAHDSTQASSSDRVKLYVNGVLQSTTVGTVITQNQDSKFNSSGSVINVGRRSAGGGEYFDGVLSHFHFIDGTAYDASAFGETDATTGIWKPKTSPSVTYGTNGFFLKFENSGSLGLDSSGNGNNFTVGGGTPTQTVDTPSNVFATLNPLYLNSGTGFSNGNLTYTYASLGWKSGVSNLAVSKGKYYFEVKFLTQDAGSVSRGWYGICGVDQADALYSNSWLGSAQPNYSGIAYGIDGGTVFSDNTQLFSGSTPAVGSIIGIAVDLDNDYIYFSENGTWINSGDPTSGASGTGGFSIPAGLSSEYVFGTSSYNGSSSTCNFGNGYFGTTAVSSAQSPSDGVGIFEYAVPTGYKALCTKSINAQEYS